MAHLAGRTASRAWDRLTAVTTSGARPGERRHPLVAAAMVLPLAVLLTVAFGGVDAVIFQASSVVGMLGR